MVIFHSYVSSPEGISLMLLAQGSHIPSHSHQGTVHLAPRRILRVEIQNHRLQGLADHQGKAHLRGVAVPGPAVEHAFNNPWPKHFDKCIPYITIHHNTSCMFVTFLGTIIDLFTANSLPPAVFNPVLGAAHAHHLAGILGREILRHDLGLS